MKNKKEKKMRSTLQFKLVGIFLLTAFVVFLANMIVYANMNLTMTKIDRTYVTNQKILKLKESLDLIQNSLVLYLNTKSSDSLEEYYNHESAYQELLLDLNTNIVEDKSLITEKNISNLSLNYLEAVKNAIDARRGRNIEKYQEYFQEASDIYKYLNACISSLNNMQFMSNTSNYTMLLNSIKLSEIINLAILSGAAAINIILIVSLTKTITAPLTQLAQNAIKIGKGNLAVSPIKTSHKDEIGIVTNAFNQMVLSLNDYILKLKKSLEFENRMKEKEILMESHLKDAKLKYLQAQINPHFLFNTLNAGAQLAMIEEADATYQYIHKVAEFFRYNVKKDDKATTLKEELELVENYIYILNVRFSGDIRFEKEVDEDLLVTNTPSMFLQPIVENCIKHGFENMESIKEIFLSIKEENGRITVSISDNGKGMDPEMITKILAAEETEFEKAQPFTEQGVGMRNVISRLKLFYGRQDVMKIESQKGLGTTFTIYLDYSKITTEKTEGMIGKGS